MQQITSSQIARLADAFEFVDAVNEGLVKGNFNVDSLVYDSAVDQIERFYTRAGVKDLNAYLEGDLLTEANREVERRKSERLAAIKRKKAQQGDRDAILDMLFA